MDTSTISVWETPGKRAKPPSSRYVRRLEKALNAPPGLLMETAGYLPADQPESIARVIQDFISEEVGDGDQEVAYAAHRTRLPDAAYASGRPPSRPAPRLLRLSPVLTHEDEALLRDIHDLLVRRRWSEADDGDL